ncbi:uncharacterized protein EI90DRAFT_3067826 [Cantharellus anzutake]|uniref:uncharacterized protein n=1 Tax=Cantharellus anzutake TaxID=1750568 RepID=UPI0019043A24|nr:uncharacterized protein EI90DRAFT_3067826 [Cantharellus anzutake]KAF8327448.1 hypothetical protein EI90DRAFT_3067826 [Cantharellus anzutake]
MDLQPIPCDRVRQFTGPLVSHRHYLAAKIRNEVRHGHFTVIGHACKGVLASTIYSQDLIPLSCILIRVS